MDRRLPRTLTFSCAPAAICAPGAGTSTSCTTTRRSGTGCWGRRRAAGHHHPPPHHRRPPVGARRRRGRRRRASVRRWYAFTRMQKRVARRLPSVLTVSGSSQQEIVDHLGVARDRVHVVHIGADTDLFSPDPSVPQVPGRIVTTSSADVPLRAHPPRRGARQGAHRAPRRASRRRRQTRRGRAGRPGHRAVRPRARRRVRQGHLGRGARRPRTVRRGRLRAVPVRGVLLPAAEAMATGTPLVATTGGAIPEVAGPDGDLPRGSARRLGALAAALSRVLGDPELGLRLGSAGRARVLDRFTWARAAEGTVAHYREAMALSHARLRSRGDPVAPTATAPGAALSGAPAQGPSRQRSPHRQLPQRSRPRRRPPSRRTTPPRQPSPRSVWALFPPPAPQGPRPRRFRPGDGRHSHLRS